MKTHKDTRFAQLLPAHVADITCMDPSLPPVVAEKVCKTARLIGFVLQNGVSKSKVVHDVNVMMKRGKNLGKSLNNVMERHHEALTCRSRDAHTSFVSPMAMEYQFSCSGSPPRPSQALSHVRKRRVLNSPMYNRHSHSSNTNSPRPGRRESETKACGHRINVNVKLCRGDDIRASALVGVSSASDNHTSQCSPMSTRRKVTGSGSTLNDDAGQKEYRVDEAAEEFIEKFYRELRLQKWLDHYC
ncbi:hypothetical protein L6164_024104 [Bauhinia variegata]|uniref:Uncharacterized protein n=1 Tax=Bauhinia variegata TaxID=167791 RepID=A0ACB9LWR9_BAUVA|nr:hypothetical protein L6164_024104 [Bauhinia variegata]